MKKTEIEHFVESLHVRRLWDLRWVCEVSLDRVAVTYIDSANERQTIPAREEVLHIFDALVAAFPITTSLLDLQAISEQVIAECTNRTTPPGRRRILERIKQLEGILDSATERRHGSREGTRFTAPVSAVICLKDAIDARIRSCELNGRDRAAAFLRSVASNPRHDGDLEALVYLRSRGHSCSDQVEKTVERWKQAAEKALATDKTKKLPTSFWHLPVEDGHMTIDATVLRAAQWCEIGGFDQWWVRWVEESMGPGGLAHEGEPDDFLAVYLFSISRSDILVQMGRQMVEKCIAAFLRDKHADAGFEAPVLFAIYRVQSAVRTMFGTPIVDDLPSQLMSAQLSCGGWGFCGADDNPSVAYTAMAVHALSLAKPRGWEHAVRIAAKWLWSRQNEIGYWHDLEFSPEYVTVLVLDAIDLVEGKTDVTFRLPQSSTQAVHEGDLHSGYLTPSISEANEIADPLESSGNTVIDAFLGGLGIFLSSLEHFDDLRYEGPSDPPGPIDSEEAPEDVVRKYRECVVKQLREAMAIARVLQPSVDVILSPSQPVKQIQIELKVIEGILCRPCLQIDMETGHERVAYDIDLRIEDAISRGKTDEAISTIRTAVRGAYDSSGMHLRRLLSELELSKRWLATTLNKWVGQLREQERPSDGASWQDPISDGHSQQLHDHSHVEKMKTRFTFYPGQVLFDGKDLRLPTGFTVEVARKLAENLGRTVPYGALDANCTKEASDQLRKAKRAIVVSLQKWQVPCDIVSKPREGYCLCEKLGRDCTSKARTLGRRMPRTNRHK